MPTSGSELAEQIHEIAAGWSKRATELEAMVTRLERQRVADGQEIRALSKVVAEWEPKTCEGPGCKALIPNEAHVALFARLGLGGEIGFARAGVLREGFCSEKCLAGWVQDHSGNVLPFPAAQTEGA